MLFCLFLALLHFVACFPSLLSALSNFPAKLGRVRYIKHKRIKINYLSAFSLITCKTSYKSAINLH